MKKEIIASAFIVLTCSLSAQMVPEETEWYTPTPPKVTPAKTPGAAPSDAIILFDGKDLSRWKAEKGDAQWVIRNGELTVITAGLKPDERVVMEGTDRLRDGSEVEVVDPATMAREAADQPKVGAEEKGERPVR